MKKIFMPILLGLLLIVGTLAAFAAFRQEKVTAAPEVFKSGISGGCYIASQNSCKIHIDPFMINVDDVANEKLVEFRVLANGSIVYQFKTDVESNLRPTGDYTPTLVMQDFAATCGETYHLDLVARDEGDGDTLFIVGTSGEFTCPSSVP